MRNKKKGFTLVELLVVIAILAILATVAIVGYTSFTRKASLSNDEAIVTQMNKILKGYEALDEKARYPHEAVQQCIENGFIYQNLKAESKNHIFLYDSKTNRFCLYNEESKQVVFSDKNSTLSTNDADFFECVDASLEKPTKLPKHSLYLYTTNKESFDAHETWQTIELNTGIDTGTVTGIKTVVYDNSEAEEGQNVVIRTNGGKLTINAENDIVNHYGEIVNLHIKAVAPSSYHEFGTVNFAQVDKGRFVVENEGSVGVAYVESATATLVGEYNVAVKLSEADTSAFTKTGDVVTLNYKAYAGKTGYNSVQEAVNAATNGQTVVLLSDVIGNVEISASKDIVIDFGGHTITSNNMDFGKAGFYNLGKVTLKSGTFTHEKPATGKSFYLIQNHGTMVMENLSVIGYAESASMVMNGSDSGTGIKGVLTINNCSLIQEGEFVALKNEFGNCVVNDSVLSRKNTDNVINAWNDVTLNNCTVIGGIMFGNCLGKHTTLTINGGTYDCLHIHEWLCGAQDTANLVVKDASFTNPNMKAVFGSQDKTKPVGSRYSTEGTLDIEMTNTKIAADLSQWLAK